MISISTAPQLEVSFFLCAVWLPRNVPANLARWSKICIFYVFYIYIGIYENPRRHAKTCSNIAGHKTENWRSETVVVGGSPWSWGLATGQWRAPARR